MEFTFKDEKTGLFVDHKGNFFKKRKDLFHAYGLDAHEFNMRERYLSSKEECLAPEKGMPWVREDGTRYKFFKDYVKSYGWAERPINERCLKEGMTLQEALHVEKNKGAAERCRATASNPCYDHLGQFFNSQDERAQFYGLDARTVDERLKRWKNDLKRALETPLAKSGRRCKPIQDHEGTWFPSIEDMCRAWHITRGFYESRKKSGWTIREILTDTKRFGLNEIRLFNALNDRNIQYYYSCSVRDMFDAMHKSLDIDLFLDYLNTSMSTFKKASRVIWNRKKIEDMRFDFSVCMNHDGDVTGVITFSRKRKIFHDEQKKTLGGTDCYSYSEFVRFSLLEYLDLPYMRISRNQTQFISEMVDDFLSNIENYKAKHNLYVKECDFVNYSFHDWEMAPGIA